MRKISVITKHFGKLIKPFLLDKVRSTNKMTLIDKEEIIMDEYNTTKVLNTFFSKVVSNLSHNIRTVNLLLTISVILF